MNSSSYWITRVIFLRFLGFIYFVAFLVSFEQNRALIGRNGLTPINADRFMMQPMSLNIESASVESIMDFCKNAVNKIIELPTIFWFLTPSDVNIELVSFIGMFLSGFLAVHGGSNMILMTLLWFLYSSLVNIGGVWYGFGWESQLLETGFLSIFLVPLIDLTKYPQHLSTPYVCIFGFRWLLFRIMFGAGLIKIRGDSCWTDLTCMNYHYQTQPVPNPLSPYYHFNNGRNTYLVYTYC